MRKAATKALYLFLCSILGMVLFAMLHRAIFVLYDLVLIMDYDTYSLGMSQAGILALDFFTMLAALFFGGWYGIILGLDWYSAVYGVRAETKPGLFHGFVPHAWRQKQTKAKADNVFAGLPEVKPVTTTVKVTSKDEAPAKSESAESTTTKAAAAKTTPAKTTTTKKPARKTAAKKRTVRKTTKAAASKTSESKPAVQDVDSMSFEDFLRVTTEKKKTAAKKPARKTAAKKTVKTTVNE